MKGQRLFVRETDRDTEALETARKLGLPEPPASSRAWIAFLVGDAVAVAGVNVENGIADLRFLQVTEPLRRLRIGTVLLREIETSLAPSTRLVVRKDLLPRAFLLRNGFVEEETRFTRPDS